MFRVILISDQKVVHDALRQIILPLVPFVSSCACYFSIDEAISTEKSPQLILLEYCLHAEKYGHEYIPELRAKFPHARIVGYSVDDGSRRLFLEIGADGFISKFDTARGIASEISSILKKEGS